MLFMASINKIVFLTKQQMALLFCSNLERNDMNLNEHERRFNIMFP